MTTIFYFLLAISILVFVHEMGHYLAARQCRVEVVRFSIGFGKTLVKRVSRKTGTEWVIAAIPMGGYVKMKDESFDGKSLAARSWIVFAGPLANLMFAALAYTVLFGMDRQEPQPLLGQPQAASSAAASGLLRGDRVTSIDGKAVQTFSDVRWRIAQSVIGEGAKELRLTLERNGGTVDTLLRIPAVVAASKAGKDHKAAEASSDPAAIMLALGLVPMSESVRVIRVQDGSAADKAGLRANDRILKMSGEPMVDPNAVIDRVKASKGEPLEFVVDDGTGPERVVIQPRAAADGIYRIGAVVGADVATITVSDDLFTALVKGITRTGEMTMLTFQAMGRMILGDLSWRQISGPVSIADAAGQSASSGLKTFIGFLALISISIAALNLLPVPMLDGGHLLYYFWEFIRGRPLPEEVQEAGRKLGIALIMMLTLVALFNDFVRIAGW